MRCTPPGRPWMASTSMTTSSRTTGDRRSTPMSARLSGFARRLDGIPLTHLNPREQVEHQIVASNIRARQFELEAVRTWERNPHFYADTLASSLAAQAIFTYAPEPSAPAACSRSSARCRGSCRRRATTSPTRQRFTSKSAPTRGAGRCRSSMPICRARFPASTTCTCWATSPTRARKRCNTIGAYVTDLETDIRPKAKGTFRLGRDRFEQKLRLEEGITLPIEKLLAIATRELESTQAEFRQLAGRLNGGDPMKVWREEKEKHPQAGTLIATARGQLDELHTFLSRNPVVPMPESVEVAVAPTPEFFRWASASMWTPGPFESKPSRAHVLPDRRRPEVGSRTAVGAPARLQPAHALDDFHPRGLPGSLTCTTSSCARWSPRSAVRRCLRRRPT